jgi:hypothetical protein
MPTEKETREAIAAVIGLAAPDAVVIPRNQLGLLADGDFVALISSSLQKIRGWIVTQSGAELISQGQAWADYRFTWRVVQVHEYKTGDDTTNSEDAFASDRDAVLLAFLNPAGVAGITQGIIDDLGNIGALNFAGANAISVIPGREGGKRVHIADGSISALCKVGVCS